MFGKPEWFSEKTVGWGLRPVSWRGWAYAVVWVIVICLPFASLMSLRLIPEALVWVVASVGTLLWDVRQVLGSLRRDPNEEVIETAVALEPEDASPGIASSLLDQGHASEAQEADEGLFVIDENTQPDPSYFNTRSYDLHWRR